MIHFEKPVVSTQWLQDHMADPKLRVFEASGLTYKGPADLYVFPTATYLSFRDQWISRFSRLNTKVVSGCQSI
jgi:hypothetical protein